jgi:ribosome biogenesis GTPase
MKGRVLKSTGSWYQVHIPDVGIVDARVRGNVRLQGYDTTNPIAVGDNVVLEKVQDEYRISELQPRHNYIVRRSVNLSKRRHVLAANVDLALMMVTVRNPRTPFGFIDRMLVTAEAYHIQPLLLLNKADSWNDEDKAMALECEEVYAGVPYEVLEISATAGWGIEKLRAALEGKTIIVMGHSGTGKSSLLNALQPGLGLRVGQNSDVHMQGKHTTTFAEMFLIEPDISIIDTPGIREFGLSGMEMQEVGHYFPEIRRFMGDCRFNNCLHLHEPGCAVIPAVERGGISALRYRSYLGMLAEIEEFSQKQ